jgi:hypothetical protein
MTPCARYARMCPPASADQLQCFFRSGTALESSLYSTSPSTPCAIPGIQGRRESVIRPPRQHSYDRQPDNPRQPPLTRRVPPERTERLCSDSDLAAFIDNVQALSDELSFDAYFARGLCVAMYIDPFDFNRTSTHAFALSLDSSITDRACAVVVDLDLRHATGWSCRRQLARCRTSTPSSWASQRPDGRTANDSWEFAGARDVPRDS